MKGFVRWMSLVAAAAVLAVSCSKDKPKGSLSFNAPAAYLRAGQKLTVGFSASSNIAASSYYISQKPEGWDDPVIDASARTVSITAPESFDDGTVRSGSVVLTGAPGGGPIASATLFVGVVDGIALDDPANGGGPANSYLVSKPETYYTFDALHKGDGSTPLATARVDILWQSVSGLVNYVDFRNGDVSFFVGADDDGELQEGNALLGAYDAAGTLLWSWHLWVTGYDPDDADRTVTFNGYRMMDRNLGALDNRNGSAEEILASYGLYYQWGRKDPFIGPSTYQASRGASAKMYDGSGKTVTTEFVLSDAATGTTEYAQQHPLTFLLTEKQDGDWLVTGSSSSQWSDTKSVNDPCPAGWRVAPAAAFDGLAIVEDITAQDAAARYDDSYGWTLERNGVSSLFIGAGYRTYLDGKISNIYDNLPVPTALASRNEAIDLQPWVGYYWTTGTQQGLGTTFYFWFDKSDPAQSGVLYAKAMGRANGMQVRCVREE